jgi:cell division protease FtsH
MASRFSRHSHRRTLPQTVSGAIAASWLLLQALVALPPALAQEQAEEEEFTYGDFLEQIEEGQVEQVDIDPDRGIAEVRLRGDSEEDDPRQVLLFAGDGRNPELIQRLRQQDVDVEIQPSGSGGALAWIATNTLIVMVVVFGLVLILRRSAGGAGGAMSFGRSRARFQMEAKTGVQFDDVAGIEEAKKNCKRWCPSSKILRNSPP